MGGRLCYSCPVVLSVSTFEMLRLRCCPFLEMTLSTLVERAKKDRCNEGQVWRAVNGSSEAK